MHDGRAYAEVKTQLEELDELPETARVMRERLRLTMQWFGMHADDVIEAAGLDPQANYVLAEPEQLANDQVSYALLLKAAANALEGSVDGAFAFNVGREDLMRAALAGVLYGQAVGAMKVPFSDIQSHVDASLKVRGDRRKGGIKSGERRSQVWAPEAKRIANTTWSTEPEKEWTMVAAIIRCDLADRFDLPKEDSLVRQLKRWAEAGEVIGKRTGLN